MEQQERLKKLEQERLPNEAPIPIPIVKNAPLPNIQGKQVSPSPLSNVQGKQITPPPLNQSKTNISKQVRLDDTSLDQEDENKTNDKENNNNKSKNKEDSESSLYGIQDLDQLDLIKSLCFINRTGCIYSPIKLKSLERIKITNMALGQHHSLFIDNQQNVYKQI